MDRSKIFVMTHGSDPDGIGSAALIRRKYNVPLQNIFFLDYGNDKLKYAVENIRKKLSRNNTLFIADTGIGDSHVHIFADLIKRIRKNGGNVFWLDHHYWKEEHIEKVAKLCDLAIVGENKDACATEIVQKELQLNDAFSIKLAKLVHKTDFAHISPARISDPNDAMQIYNFVFSYYYNLDSISAYTNALRRMVDIESKGRLFDAKLLADARKFEKRTEDVMDYIKAHTYMVKDNIAVGFGSSINSNIACQAMTDLTKVDVVIYVNLTHAKGHVRSKKANIVGLAQHFDGGGHPHAAGFPIDIKRFGGLKTEKSRKEFADYLSKIRF